MRKRSGLNSIPPLRHLPHLCVEPHNKTKTREIGVNTRENSVLLEIAVSAEIIKRNSLRRSAWTSLIASREDGCKTALFINSLGLLMRNFPPTLRPQVQVQVQEES